MLYLQKVVTPQTVGMTCLQRNCHLIVVNPPRMKHPHHLQILAKGLVTDDL